MPIADVNGIKIAYDRRGPTDRPAILLIMGLGTQMTAWSDPFCDALAAGGYQVVRFDNVTSGCHRRSRVAGRDHELSLHKGDDRAEGARSLHARRHGRGWARPHGQARP